MLALSYSAFQNVAMLFLNVLLHRFFFNSMVVSHGEDFFCNVTFRLH